MGPVGARARVTFREFACSDRDGPGRDETRTIKILSVDGAVGLDFPGISQIARVRRWRRDRKSGKAGYETVYYLTRSPVIPASCR